MIARTWHGAVPSHLSDEYFRYLMDTGVPDLKATRGNRGVFVLRRVEGGVAHFQLISLWDSLDAIEKFAGADIDRARYYPEDEQYLQELEPTVTHYEVLEPSHTGG
jgi:heme-degrading monooxygenase HmoA